MTVRILALAAANVLVLGLGAGMLPLLRLARTPQELLARLLLAYAVGLAATGILAAELALAGVGLGWIGLAGVTAATLAVGLRRLERSRAGPPAPLLRELPSLAVLAVVAAFLAVLVAASAVKPLLETDGWQLWALRARALYELGRPAAPVFTSTLYPGQPYPLWLPALEAADFRFMGAFDGTLVHLQLAGLAIAFVGGAWILLRRSAQPFLLAVALLVIVTAPTVFNQLRTNFADIPLALLTALGVAALAAWMQRGDAGLLPAAALFLGAATLTKPEGLLFALAALVAALVVARRAQLRPLALALGTVFAIYVPWAVWVGAHHPGNRAYRLSDLLSISYLARDGDRVWPVVRELAAQMRATPEWSHLTLFVVIGLAGALLLRRLRAVAFAGAWLGLSFAGLVAIYWISRTPLANHLYNSADRTIDTLMVGAALLVPVLLFPGASPDAERSLPGRTREERGE